MPENHIYVKDVIRSTNAVSTEDGEKVYNVLLSFFEKEQPVEVDFDGIDLIISTFLNASIGKLYGKYDGPFLQKHLHVKNMAQDDVYVLRLVVERAKIYFSNNPFPDAY